MKIARLIQLGLIMLTSGGGWSSFVHAGTMATGETGIFIQNAQTAIREEVYYLNANIAFNFSEQILEALRKGVPVTVVLNIGIFRKRDYIWNETITTLEQRYEIDYHALTRQFMVRNLNIGTQRSFPTIEAAIYELGVITDLPLLDSSLLSEGDAYRGRLLARVDINALPVPLRLFALISPDWRLGSEWYLWEF